MRGMTTKDHLLSYLKERQGEWLSGQSLSRRLAISRSAVWKHISRLRQEGYLIESLPKKGYVLRRRSARLLPNEIREGLCTRSLGKQGIAYFERTDSTNIRAKDMAQRGVPEGTLAVAEEQTGGRGRRGRTWYSPPGKGLYATIILRPTIPPSEAPRITLLTAVVLAEALRSLTGLEARIKWPNDILIQGRKVAGILTEISTEMDAIEYIVVGVGVNINISRFPVPLKDQATSLLLETGRPFSRIKVLHEFLTRYEASYERFKGAGFEGILDRFRGLSEILGRRIAVDAVDKTRTGEVQRIDRDGALLLKDEKGRMHRVYSGDVIYL